MLFITRYQICPRLTLKTCETIGSILQLSVSSEGKVDALRRMVKYVTRMFAGFSAFLCTALVLYL